MTVTQQPLVTTPTGSKRMTSGRMALLRYRQSQTSRMRLPNISSAFAADGSACRPTCYDGRPQQLQVTSSAGIGGIESQARTAHARTDPDISKSLRTPTRTRRARSGRARARTIVLNEGTARVAGRAKDAAVSGFRRPEDGGSSPLAFGSRSPLAAGSGSPAAAGHGRNPNERESWWFSCPDTGGSRRAATADRTDRG